MPVTLLEYLQRANPALTLASETRASTDNTEWEPIENYILWEEFNYDTCLALYKDILLEKYDRAALPDPLPLLDWERLIYSENELDHDPLHRNIIFRVNMGLQVAYSFMNNRKHDQDFAEQLMPVITCGSKQPWMSEGYSGRPDWRTCQQAYKIPMLCAETKLSSVFSMQNVVAYHDNDELARPLMQCVHYCNRAGTRFGAIISDKEFVPFRIHSEEIGSGSARDRPRRNISPVRYSVSSHGSSQPMSLYSEDSRKRGAPSIEYAIVPWDATDGMTIGLAWWFLVMIATAPTNSSVGPEATYEPMNRWKMEGNQYRNNTSGRKRSKLEARHIEISASHAGPASQATPAAQESAWMDLLTPEGVKYFCRMSDRRTTYIEELMHQGQRYYHDNLTGNSVYNQPDSLFKPYLG